MSSAEYDDLWDDTPGSTPYIEPTEQNAVRRDTFDQMSWDMLTDSVPALREQVNALAQDFTTSPVAYEDLFNLLHQGDPRFTPEGQIVNEYLPQRALMASLFEGEDFKQLRRDTKYDEYQTAFAMLTMAGDMRKGFEALQEVLDNQPPPPNGPWRPGEGPPQPGEDDLGPAIQAIERGLEKARKAVDEEKELVSGIAGSQDGELQQMSFAERRALAERIDRSKLEKFAKLLGAFRPFADGERRHKLRQVPDEIADIKIGDHLPDLVPSELLNLAVPELEDLFMLRLAQKRLLVWDKRGTEKAGQGPIIVVCDESQSMRQHKVDKHGNTREEWAKAFTIALCDQARQGKRDFTYIGFSSRTQQWRLDFPGGATPISKVLELAEHFFDGGTSYVEPLTMALEIVQEYERTGRPKPDVVFITDDECTVPEEFIEQWNATRASAQVRSYGIAIGVNGYSNNLKDLTDRCINITKLNASPEGVQELFRTI